MYAAIILATILFRLVTGFVVCSPHNTSLYYDLMDEISMDMGIPFIYSATNCSVFINDTDVALEEIAEILNNLFGIRTSPYMLPSWFYYTHQTSGGGGHLGWVPGFSASVVFIGITCFVLNWVRMKAAALQLNAQLMAP